MQIQNINYTCSVVIYDMYTNYLLYLLVTYTLPNKILVVNTLKYLLIKIYMLKVILVLYYL